MKAVTPEYLDKVRFAVRRSSGTHVDAELTDIVQQCRADLERLGVAEAVAEDEANPLILGAVRCFARWQFGINGDDADRNREDYLLMADGIRKMRQPE
ncbi:MAG: hypothetical protein E7572_05510 [Ruminococcaceae bacterium]|jgi:hypothetical protein|nr:hypothetical protein [Oscillospiraceae bacterium]